MCSRKGGNLSLACVPVGVVITYGDTVVPQGEKYVCGICNLHMGYSLNVSGLSSLLVIVFSEPFIGFRVSGSETVFRVPRFYRVPFGSVIPVRKFHVFTGCQSGSSVWLYQGSILVFVGSFTVSI